MKKTRVGQGQLLVQNDIRNNADHRRKLATLSITLGALLAPALALATEEQPSGPTHEQVAAYNQALTLTTTNGQIAGTTVVKTCLTERNGDGSINNQNFQKDCGIIVLGAEDDTIGSAQALTDIAADQINAQNSVAVRAAGLGVSMIQGRLAKLRLAGGQSFEPITVVALAPLSHPLSGGGASGDAAFGRFGGFVNARYTTGNADETDFQPGYDFDGWSILGGVDYRFDDNLIGGVAIRYADGKADYDSNRGDMTGDAWGLSLYGSYTLDSGLYIDGLVGYGKNDYTLKRRITYAIGEDIANQVAKSDPDADLWDFNIGAGYTFSKNEWSITPSARLNYLQNEVDSYRERTSSPLTTGGSMALAIDSQTFTSFTSDLGVQIAKAISTKSGVIMPQLRLGWVHEFENSQESVGARFVNDINNTPLFVLTDQPDRDYVNLSVGVSGQFAGGRSAFLEYNTLLGYKDVNYNAVNAGVRFEF